MLGCKDEKIWFRSLFIHYRTNIYESSYFVLGVGNTGVSDYGFCPRVAFSLGRKELEEEEGGWKPVGVFVWLAKYFCFVFFLLSLLIVSQ